MNFGIASLKNYLWYGTRKIDAQEYMCSFCSKHVASDVGYILQGGSYKAKICICSNCKIPTFFDNNSSQFPAAIHHENVEKLPKDVEALMGEIYGAYSSKAYTLIVLCCRKVLMHIAVEQGADEKKNFVHYVEFLSSKGYIPPNSVGWVDHLRQKGNEANHEITIYSEKDAKILIDFTVMLLKIIYEFPQKIPTKPSRG